MLWSIVAAQNIYVHLLVCYLNYKMHGAAINILVEGDMPDANKENTLPSGNVVSGEQGVHSQTPVNTSRT